MTTRQVLMKAKKLINKPEKWRYYDMKMPDDGCPNQWWGEMGSYSSFAINDVASIIPLKDNKEFDNPFDLQKEIKLGHLVYVGSE